MNQSTKLWNKNFILYLIGFELSEIGWGLTFFALPLYILMTTNNPTLLGTLLSLTYVPYIFLMPIGGVMADRYHKGKLMVIISLLTSITIGAYVLLMDNTEILPLTIIALVVLSSLSSLTAPTNEAVVPFIVPEEQLMKANSATWIGGIFSNVGTPILAGFLMRQFGINIILILSLVAYLLTTLFRYLLKIPYEKQVTNENILKIILGDIQESLRFIIKEKPIMARVALVLFFYGVTTFVISAVLAPVLISEYLGLDAGWVGVATGLISVGGVVGVLLLNMLKDKATVEKLQLFLILLNLFLILTGIGIIISANTVLTYVLITIGFLLAFSFGNAISLICFTYIGTYTPEHLIGKVMAINMAIVFISMVASNYLFGWFLDVFSSNPGIAVIIVPTAMLLASLGVRVKDNS